MMEIRIWTCVVVFEYGPLFIYTKLEGPSIAKLDSYFSRYDP